MEVLIGAFAVVAIGTILGGLLAVPIVILVAVGLWKANVPPEGQASIARSWEFAKKIYWNKK